MSLIDEYKRSFDTVIPIWFDEAKSKLNKNYYNKHDNDGNQKCQSDAYFQMTFISIII